MDFAKSSTRGNRSYLRVGAGAVAYLKFQVTDPPSDPHAVLWLHSSTQSQTKISAYQAASSDWSATDLTWNNQPGSTGSPLVHRHRHDPRHVDCNRLARPDHRAGHLLHRAQGSQRRGQV